MREKMAVFKGKTTKNHGCYFQIPSARETYCKMHGTWLANSQVTPKFG
jgi:hypothetical protein